MALSCLSTLPFRAFVGNGGPILVRALSTTAGMNNWNQFKGPTGWPKYNTQVFPPTPYGETPKPAVSYRYRFTTYQTILRIPCIPNLFLKYCI